MTEDLLGKALRGVKWTTFATFVSIVCQLGFMAILARLLDPAAFGLMALTNVALRFASYFSQMGVGPALIWKPDLHTNDIRASFTLSVLISVIFFLLAWMLAPLGGVLFKSAELTPLIRVASLSFVLIGLSITSVSLLQRELKFGHLSAVEISSYVLGYGTIGVILAYLGFGVWSLILALLGQSLIKSAAAFSLVRHEIAPIFSWASYKSLLSFGSRYSLANFLGFLGANMDTMFIGRLQSSALLGVYNRAFMLANLPVQHMVQSITKVLYPALARQQKDRARMGETFVSISLIVGIVSASIAFGMIPAAHNLVLVLLGDKWRAAIPVFQVLAIAVPLNFMSNVAAIVLDSLAALNTRLTLQGSYVVFLGALLYGFSEFGLVGFAIAVVLGEALRFTAYLIVLKRYLGLKTLDLYKTQGWILVVSISVTASVWLAGFIFSSEYIYNASAWVVLIFQVLSGGVTLVLIVLFTGKKLFSEGIAKDMFDRLLQRVSILRALVRG